MIKIGSKEISALKLGARIINAVKLGLVTVWELVSQPDWYQYLPLGLEDDLVNKGTGLSAVDGLLVSGSMATEDISFDWIRGDAGLQSVADQYGVINPMIYAGLVQLKTSNQWEIIKH